MFEEEEKERLSQQKSDSEVKSFDCSINAVSRSPVNWQQPDKSKETNERVKPWTSKQLNRQTDRQRRVWSTRVREREREMIVYFNPRSVILKHPARLRCFNWKEGRSRREHRPTRQFSEHDGFLSFSSMEFFSREFKANCTEERRFRHNWSSIARHPSTIKLSNELIQRNLNNSLLLPSLFFFFFFFFSLTEERLSASIQSFRCSNVSNLDNTGRSFWPRERERDVEDSLLLKKRRTWLSLMVWLP